MAELTVRGDPRVSPLRCLDQEDDDDEDGVSDRGAPTGGGAGEGACPGVPRDVLGKAQSVRLCRELGTFVLAAWP